MIDVRLDLIAAKAKQLAEDHKTGRLWPDDLNRGLRELEEQIQLVQQERRNTDNWGR